MGRGGGENCKVDRKIANGMHSASEISTASHCSQLFDGGRRKEFYADRSTKFPQL